MMHGKLDEGAAFALDELLAMAQEHDADIDAGQMMSRAIRLYHAVCTGGVEITPSPDLQAMMADAGLSCPGVRH